MKKIDIMVYRSSNVESKKMIELDVEIIKNLLKARGLVKKQAGLCAEPWDKYFSLCYQDSAGVSHSINSNINACYIKVNEATGTYSKKKFYYSIHIVRTTKDYYVVALAQTSRYKESTGAKNVVYRCQEDELNKVLDILFKNVK